MSFGIVATVVGAGAAVYGSNKASKEASKARRDARAQNAKAENFEQQRLAEFEETYGKIEDNLAGYYTTLSADYYATRGVEALEKQQAKAFEDLRASLAQRGIFDSGIAAQIESDQQFALAEGKARVRADAPSAAAEEKFRFLQAGLGLDPSDSVSATLRARAQTASLEAADATASANEAFGSAATAVATGLSSYGPDLLARFGSGASSANSKT